MPQQQPVVSEGQWAAYDEAIGVTLAIAVAVGVLLAYAVTRTAFALFRKRRQSRDAGATSQPPSPS